MKDWVLLVYKITISQFGSINNFCTTYTVTQNVNDWRLNQQYMLCLPITYFEPTSGENRNRYTIVNFFNTYIQLKKINPFY